MYYAEKEMQNEYYNKYKNTFTNATNNKTIKRMYNIIVNPITYAIVNSISVGMILKKGNKGKHMLTKIPMIMCVSVLNMNVFLFKSKFMDSNNNIQGCTSNKVSYLFKTMVNPVFTLQKDLVLLRLLQVCSLQNVFNNRKMIANVTQKQMKDDNKKIVIKEGFL